MVRRVSLRKNRKQNGDLSSSEDLQGKYRLSSYYESSTSELKKLATKIFLIETNVTQNNFVQQIIFQIFRPLFRTGMPIF